jgi:hypothetical protein
LAPLWKCRILELFQEAPDTYAPVVIKNPTTDELRVNIEKIMEQFTVRHFNQGAKVEKVADRSIRVGRGLGYRVKRKVL